jgi:uncharacterized membrane protein
MRGGLRPVDEHGAMTQHALILWAPPALACVGLGLSLWMLRQSSGMRALPGCGAGSGCAAVTHSRWSRWCGVPVAAPASLLYLALAGGFLFLNVSPPGHFRDMVSIAMFPAAPLLAAAAAWFIALQWLAVGRFCLYCLLLHVIGPGIAGMIFADPAFAVRAGVVGWAIGVGGVAALVLGQVLVEPRMYRAVASGKWPVASVKGNTLKVGEAASGRWPVASGERRVSGGLWPAARGRNSTSNAALAAVGHLPPATASASPHSLATGCLSPAAAPAHCLATCHLPLATVNSGKWPLLGSPEAASVLVYLFDYTCENCRGLHRVLLEAMREDEGAFAVMMVPVPHDPRCNPAIAKPDPEHANACAYARLALSLWAADWTQYAAFDEFMFAPDRPPALGLARARAAAMLGQPVFDPTVPDADVDPVIREGIALYESVGAERTPTVLMPRGFFTGRVETTRELWKILGGREIRNSKSEIRNKFKIGNTNV